MPLYDYQCPDCGDFREIRPMSESTSARPCPVCGTPSQRSLSAPFLGGGVPAGWLRPAASNGQRVPWRAACGLGCSHAH
ncbi:MAG: hypothetical protein CFE45_14240 [Burkholderiales bacterium PBB5]|nr:MAG: hypothetical protein CFE45_14240 [Burkholderiales bacterium PBB5]